MKRKHIIITVIILVLAVSYVIGINYEPKSIIYRITGDFTSSGAQRNFKATLIFAGNSLVTANEEYNVSEGGGCTKDCDYKYICLVDFNNKWMDAQTSGESCRIENYIPSRRKQIENKIKQGLIKQIDSCGHGDLCYEIINY